MFERYGASVCSILQCGGMGLENESLLNLGAAREREREREGGRERGTKREGEGNKQGEGEYLWKRRKVSLHLFAKVSLHLSSISKIDFAGGGVRFGREGLRVSRASGVGASGLECKEEDFRFRA